LDIMSGFLLATSRATQRILKIDPRSDVDRIRKLL
jgi:hypothetical protein